MALNFRRFFEGIGIVAKTTSTVSVKGEMDVTSADGKLNYHNGTTSSPMVTESSTATLTNKSLSDTTTIIVDASDSTKQIKFNAAGTTGTATTITSSQTGNRTVTIPDFTGVLVIENAPATLTDKNLTDNSTFITDVSDPTKRIALDAGGTTGTTTTISASQSANRVISLPDATTTVVGTDVTQTLSNKTLDNTTTLTIKDTLFTIQDDGDTSKQAKFQTSGITTATTRTYTFPDVTDTLVTKTSTDILTNKTLSGNTASNLISGSGTFTFNTTGTITAPNATDTLVAKATTDILTNKTVSRASNTISGFTANAVATADASGFLGAGVVPGTSGNTLTSDGTNWTSAAAAAAPNQSYQLSNLGLAASIASNILTIDLKQFDGTTAPAAGAGAVKIGYRSATASAGDFTTVSTTGTTTLTIGTAVSLGGATATSYYIYIFALNNAGTTEMFASLHPYWDEGMVQTTSTTGTSNAVLYGANVRTDKAIRLIGRVRATWTTAVGWSALANIDLTPFIKPAVAVVVHGAASQTLNGTDAVVKYSTIVKDAFTSYSTSTGLVTVLVAGFYEVAGTILVTATFTATQYIAMAVYLDSATKVITRTSGPVGTNVDMTAHVKRVVFATVGQTLSVQASGNGTGSMAVDTGTTYATASFMYLGA